MTKKVKIIAGVSAASIITIGGVVTGVFISLADAKSFKINNVKNFIVWNLGPEQWINKNKENKIPNVVFPSGNEKERKIHVAGKLELKYTKSQDEKADRNIVAEFNFDSDFIIKNNNINIPHNKIMNDRGLLRITSLKKDVLLEFMVIGSLDEKDIILGCENTGTTQDYATIYWSTLTSLQFIFTY